MINLLRYGAGLLVASAMAAAPATAGPTLGQPAPAFRAMDAEGHARTLAQFKGRIVVLEWTNNGCPYVGKHYGAGAMQRLQREATRDGVVWLTVISSAPGFEGYLTAPQARAWKAKVGAASSAVLLDGNGLIGRAFEAKATPHMFIIDRAGRVAYMGGIDDQPTTDPDSLKTAHNYVAAALADLKAGRTVAQPISQPYGCAVKYGSAG